MFNKKLKKGLNEVKYRLSVLTGSVLRAKRDIANVEIKINSIQERLSEYSDGIDSAGKKVSELKHDLAEMKFKAEHPPKLLAGSKVGDLLIIMVKLEQGEGCHSLASLRWAIPTVYPSINPEPNVLNYYWEYQCFNKKSGKKEEYSELKLVALMENLKSVPSGKKK